MGDAVSWCAARLAEKLGGEADDMLEIARYLCTMTDPDEIRDYVADIFQDDRKAAQEFVHALQSYQRAVKAAQRLDNTSARPSSLGRQSGVSSAQSTQARAASSRKSVGHTNKGHQQGNRQKSSPQRHDRHTTTAKRHADLQNAAPAHASVYQKPRDDDLVYFQASSKKPEASQQQAKAKDIDSISASSSGKASNGKAGTRVASSAAMEPASMSRPETKRSKPKYVNFFSTAGRGILAELVPGRRLCECLATRHKLINNCIRCGRVVCEQEKEGPCLFCGALVVSPEHQQLLQRNSNKAQKFLSKLLEDTLPENAVYDMETMRQSALPNFEQFTAQDFELAQRQRDRLVDFDRNSVKRTNVIDDEADYFSVNSKWLSEDERKARQEQEQRLRQKQQDFRHRSTLTLDFAGRRVVEDHRDDFDIYEAARQEQVAVTGTSAAAARPLFTANIGRTDNTVSSQPDIAPIQRAAPQFDPSVLPEHPAAAANASSSQQEHLRAKGSRGTRLQDSQLSEMSDPGKCMSMHQPYASLLVQGIKRHEGRVWYTSHRGRLWIAAASKEPTEEEIRQLEDFYRALYPGQDIPFPKEYPTSCLLGFIDVEDCLDQATYREQYPNGESPSPYVFICKNPHELVVRYPVKGQHKIWQLDKQMHESAKLAVRPVEYFDNTDDWDDEREL